MIGPILAAIALVVVLGCLSSVGFVEQNEYGLMYNWVNKQIGTKVYHGGTHWIGFWNDFVTFPATVQTIEFSERIGMRSTEPLHTRTKEGLALHLSISFQYRLEQNDIPKLYALTNIQYEGLFMRIARDQMLEAAAEYEGPQYWQERKVIGHRMRQAVDGELKESYANLWGLQLLVIDLPDRFEKSITMTQVQRQIIKTRESQQVAAGIRADTEVMKAGFSRDIEVVQADADANYTLETKSADAEAARRKIEAEAEAVKYVRDKMHLSPEGVVKYSELSAYGMLDNATFLTNLQNSMPMINLARPAPQPSLIQTRSDAAAVSQAADPVSLSALPDETDQEQDLTKVKAKFLQRDGSAAQLRSD